MVATWWRALPLLLALGVALLPLAVHPQEAIANDVQQDQRVLDAVLLDLVTYTGPDEPLSVGPAPREVFFNPGMLRVTMRSALQPLQVSFGSARKGMSDSEQRNAEEAVTQLVKRTHTRASYAGYRSRDARVHVVKPGPVSDRAPYFASYPVQVSVPGYANDGTLAVVHLVFPEILHPTYWTVVLKRTNRGWKISRRGSVTFV